MEVLRSPIIIAAARSMRSVEQDIVEEILSLTFEIEAGEFSGERHHQVDHNFLW